MTKTQKKKAKIVRMVTPDHLCPWGIKAIDLLRRHHYEIEDEHLESMEANKAYKAEQGYEETPQIFLEGEHLGGYDQLREHLGLPPDPKEGETYQPVIAVFAVTFLLAVTMTWASQGELALLRIGELFTAFSMAVLGILKLQDLQSFATGFVQYDLLARRYVPYSYLYPFVEAGAGILMVAGLFTWLVAPLALLVSTLGAISVFKAVYLDKRDLNCACVGGGSSVPLGFISLTENLMMMAMSLWMLVKSAGLPT
ncbi:glutaredoxin family protein [Roseibacillus ishigakijimensis]|uniref:Glutaredoxin n=1 Tax=Roseibacillus ishigakijimensis TaxID=454146 RepID=A0A934VKD5_9BACT|nr:glutaredoxin [Roseibacillus ishigakijimensis]MBK1833539.1 glutaredoxin [Roseibacillus ishigakijimensis]